MIHLHNHILLLLSFPFADGSEGQKDQPSSKDQDDPTDLATEDPPSPTPCPLCQEPYAEYSELESHVMQIHSVNSEGLQRLLVLMEGSHWLNNKRNHANNSSNNNSDCESPSTTSNHHEATNDTTEEEKKEEEAPSSTTSETPLGTISEKHVYKYRYIRVLIIFLVSCTFHFVI